MSRVMLVSIPKGDASRFQKAFSTVQVECENVNTFEAAFERIATDPPSLVIAERPEQISVLQGLQAVLKTHAPITPFLVSMQRPDSPMALECMRAGAYDCIARPFSMFDVLAAAKRATSKSQRALFLKKVEQKKRLPLVVYVAAMIFLLWPSKIFVDLLNGPPPNELSLGSAHLSGLQWDNRSLWVGDWFDSTIIRYNLGKGLHKKFRHLNSDVIYKAQEGQPILICSTPDRFITIDSDLKMRGRHKAIGLPALNTASTPGANPTGLAWDGRDVWSTDAETGLLYRHGVDFRVLDTVKSIIPKPTGLAFDGKSLWVVGGEPLQAARLENRGLGIVWKGPYQIPPVLTQGILPSGLAVGFRRMWFVSGGDPRMVSVPLPSLQSIWKGVSRGR